jgi:NAD+ synthase (glutamine-hydrolysing)
MKRFDYYKAAACTPSVAIGDPFANAQAILQLCQKLPADTQLAVFPELCLSGYTCQDLFYEERLLQGCLDALIQLKNKLPKNLACIVGLPLVHQNQLYNTAAFLFNNEILGFYAKTYIPGYNEYYEPRWFSSASSLEKDAFIQIEGKKIPLGNNLIFSDTSTHAKIGIEICEDLWVTIPVSSDLALAGANVLCNCSASNEIIAKASYRKDLVKNQSARTYAAYIYASAGPDESSSDLVFSGHNLIAENGSLLASSTLAKPAEYVVAEIDLQHLTNDRLRFKTSFERRVPNIRTIEYASLPYSEIELSRMVEAYPFVPAKEKKRMERCQEILLIQARGLATRLKKIGCRQCVIGISGGLDSTLALLVAAKAYDLLEYDPAGIYAITMPGFGTTSRTKSNAEKLMDLLHVTSLCIPIGDAVHQHFKDISHDESVRDITYENSQARERTQILMDYANKVNGIVIGTGDLSELALGWCTYNGDHMSMYAVNASVPKTLVRYIVESCALQAKENGNKELAEVLIDICDTPVSPELLPPDASGKISQKTEEVLGSYDLHDFFLYHVLRHHEGPQKIYEHALKAFDQIDPAVIEKALRTFYWRFFGQQFKRNCMPDGVKVGSICFSPRGDWRMPSDASRALWMSELENLDHIQK